MPAPSLYIQEFLNGSIVPTLNFSIEWVVPIVLIVVLFLANSFYSHPYFDIVFLRIRAVNHRVQNLCARFVTMPLKRSRTTLSPPGLENPANACYQNAVIQALSSVDSLPSYLKPMQMRATEPTKSVAYSLAVAHTTLNVPGDRTFQPFQPKSLRSISGMNVFHQSDAQEYLSAVLDKIDNEQIQLLKEEGIDKNDPTVVKNPLEGYTVESKKCTQCQYSEGSTLNLFNCITIPIPPETYRDLPFAWLLKKHFDAEVLEGVRCTFCSLNQLAECLKENPKSSDVAQELLTRIKEAFDNPKEMDELAKSYKLEDWKEAKLILRTKKKVFSIAVPPETLVFHINRNSWTEYGPRKLYNKIKLPKVLDMKAWCKSPPPDVKVSLPDRSPSFRYRIKAVVEHYGIDGNGHYICHRTWGKSTHDASPDSWFTADDNLVYPMKQEALDKPLAAFLAFYEEIPLPGQIFQSPGDRKRSRDFISESQSLTEQRPTKRHASISLWNQKKDIDAQEEEKAEIRTELKSKLNGILRPLINGSSPTKVNGIHGKSSISDVREPKINGIHKPEANGQLETENDESEDDGSGEEDTGRETTVELSESPQKTHQGQGFRRNKKKKKKRSKKGKKRN
jgi:ubiquitin C-terminal hydrolase